MAKPKFILPVLLLGALVLIGAGCGGNGTTSVVIPKLDVAGEDIQDVPRYPGSVRVYYGPVPDTDIIVVEYLTSAGIDTVSDFYEAQLPANGWEQPSAEIMKEMGSPYIYVAQGVEKGEQQTIVLVRDSSDYSGYTNINITFGPK